MNDEQNTAPILISTHEFWWPVIAHIPQDGGHVEQRFEARFKLATDDEIFPTNMDAMTARQSIEHDRTLIEKFCVAIRGIKDPDHDLERLASKLIAYAPYRTALVRAFIEAHTDNRARTGN